MTNKSSNDIVVQIDYRPPYSFTELLRFFGARSLKGAEIVDETSYSRTVMLEDANMNVASGWVRVEDDPNLNSLIVSMPDSLSSVLPEVITRIRCQFDVDSDPRAIALGLNSMATVIPNGFREGTRLPGCFEPFETACRAVLGQQISVSAANSLATRLLHTFGRPIDSGIDGLERAWPTPEDIVAIDDIETAFGELGIIRTRARTIAAIAALAASDELDLHPDSNAADQIERLLAIKGIGPWTANYIAMRALGHPDAFLESDAGVAHALPDLSPKERSKLARQWSPWRSYAVIGLWNSLSDE